MTTQEIKKTVNAIGFEEIAEFIRSNHKDGNRIASDATCVNAWIEEAEESMDNGNPPIIEIRGHDSVTGNPITFEVSADGITATMLAAPDLLAALTAFADDVEATIAYQMEWEEVESGGTSALVDAVQSARAAIAKAKGE